jgi:peroxiredoxin
MKNKKYFILCLCFYLLIKVELYAQIPNIQLTTIENKRTTLVELMEKNPLNVFMFYSPECPICQRNTLNIRQLSAKYAESKVNFVLIYPSSFDNRKMLKRFQKKYLMTSITGILDKDNQLVKFLNAQITPEYFLLNNRAETLYSGALDNAFVEIGKKRTVVTAFYLDDAIQQSIDNKEIVVKKTEAVGCFIRK